jgi:hypothetical protein
VIVQVGSAFGACGIPLQAAYRGARHTVNGFTERVVICRASATVTVPDAGTGHRDQPSARHPAVSQRSMQASSSSVSTGLVT